MYKYALLNVGLWLSVSGSYAWAALTPEQIFQQHCGICHESGIAGAPRFRNAEDWNPRLEKAGGAAGLLTHANDGMNAMPPKGTCQECTEEELQQAIDYMLPEKP